MPAHKKDPSVRARANKATSRAVLRTVDPGDIPTMPEGDWARETVRWWNDVWSSPMASEWHESDIHNVLLCALLYNDIWLAQSAKERKDAAAEYRLQRKDLGLTPYDRRRLEWTIETAETAKDRGRARRERSTKTMPATDPRGVLRQVN